MNKIDDLYFKLRTYLSIWLSNVLDRIEDFMNGK